MGFVVSRSKQSVELMSPITLLVFALDSKFPSLSIHHCLRANNAFQDAQAQFQWYWETIRPQHVLRRKFYETKETMSQSLKLD